MIGATEMRYLVFIFDNEPFGGWNDFTAATVTLDKAQELVKYAKHYQIIDRDTLKVIQFKHED